MTPGRNFPVGHHVDGHLLSDYLEEVDCSPLDAGRSRMIDLSSDLTSGAISGVMRVVVVITITTSVLPSLRLVAIILKLVVSI